MDEPKEKPSGPAEHALVGAGVGAAGVGNSMALIGVSTAFAALAVPIPSWTMRV